MKVFRFSYLLKVVFIVFVISTFEFKVLTPCYAMMSSMIFNFPAL